MCPGFCGKVWTALQLLWCTVYVICGATQVIAGVFFAISIRPDVHLTSNIWAGSWNIIIGIIGATYVCLGPLSGRRQEILLYMGFSVIAVNVANVVLGEWGLYFFGDLEAVVRDHPNHLLIDYACFATRIASATAVAVSFFDVQFAFCSLQWHRRSNTGKKHYSATLDKINQRRKNSHEQVADIEYIIPRPKKPHSTTPTTYDQSWVFDSSPSAATPTVDHPSSKLVVPQSPYLKILTPIGEPTFSDDKPTLNGDLITELLNPVTVQIDEPSLEGDDDNSQSDRKIEHMRSFSRSTSPSGLNQTQQQTIYDYPDIISDTTKTMKVRRLESISPVVEKVQYASLMKELQRAIVSKKEDSSSGSNHSGTSTTTDTEFSKELEAALQLIQDLESPNTTGETPSEGGPAAPPHGWGNSDSDKTLSNGSTCSNDLVPPGSPTKGKVIVIPPPDSQSTSGYSSPAHDPSWSTTSSLSSNDNNNSLTYSIRKAQSGTIISLYSSSGGISATANNRNSGKSVTLVNIESPPSSICSFVDGPAKARRRDSMVEKTWRSMLRKKSKPETAAKLCPELEGAIVKSESLAYLSDSELLARHQRNKDIQRKIEERVIQQLGSPGSESNC